jgi:transposase
MLERERDRLGEWIDGLQKRMHVNKVTVSVAAKVDRIAWVILTRSGALYVWHDPVLA